MKILSLMIVLLAAAASNAQSRVTATIDLSSKNYTAEVSYEVLSLTSPAKAYDVINKGVLEIISQGCDPVDALESETGFDHFAQAKIIAENIDYVGYEVTSGNYCGGAHPNYYIYHLTFDAATGLPVDMNKEVPKQDFDNADSYPNFYDDLTVYQNELAEIIASNIKPTADKDLAGFEDCFSESGMTKAELTEELALLFPTIAGLAENKKVVLSISPPHVMAACTFSVQVPYSEVSKYIDAGSILHSWLK